MTNRTNEIAQTTMRAQCSKGHWNALRLILDRSLRNQVVAAGQKCVKCGEAF
jgi:hypothetical protein